MSLTGLPLLFTGVAVTLLLAVATGVLWWRTGKNASTGAIGATGPFSGGGRIAVRRRLVIRGVVRPLALLLVEAAAIATVAIGTNRALEIYPSWSVLFGDVHSVDRAAAAPAAGLEEWLHTQATHGRDHGLAFSWKPTAEAAWRLPSAPVVAVPAGYFRDEAARFPVIVVVGPRHTTPAAAGWDDRHALQAAQAGAPAVVVFVRTDDPAAARPVVATALPNQLIHDLRVEPANWGVAGVGADQPLALDLLHDDSDRYRTAALVGDGPQPSPGTLLGPARHLPVGLDLVVVAAKPAGDGLVSEAVPRPSARLAAALRWIKQRTPPPLAQPLVDPTAPAAKARS